MARAEIARLSEALKEMSVRLMLAEGKGALGLSGRVPQRVDVATKAGVLGLIDRAVADGWEHRRACRYLELDEGRAWRWRRRRDHDGLDDGRPGSAVHGLRPEEVSAILALFEAWRDVERGQTPISCW